MTYRIEVVNEADGAVLVSETGITAEDLLNIGFSVEGNLTISQSGN